MFSRKLKSRATRRRHKGDSNLLPWQGLSSQSSWSIFPGGVYPCRVLDLHGKLPKSFWRFPKIFGKYPFLQKVLFGDMCLSRVRELACLINHSRLLLSQSTRREGLIPTADGRTIGRSFTRDDAWGR